MFKLPTSLSGSDPLINAILNCKPDVVRLLIRRQNADVNMRSPDIGKTPLHLAAQLGFKAIVLILIEEKADVNAVTVAGFTPLHVAAQNGHSEIIVELAKAGAKINIISKVGCTPLHESAAKGHKEATLKLLELKADPNIRDNRYYLTAANLAHENRHIVVRDILVSAMTYQQQFIQNINFILFNWKRAFIDQSLEYQFIDKLSNAVRSIEGADEVFKIISLILKSPEYEHVKEKLIPMRGLLVTNMKQYNTDKLEANKSNGIILPKNHP